MSSPVTTVQQVTTYQATVAATVATASTLASFSTPLRIACAHAVDLYFGVASNQAITVTLRHYGAGRRIQIDNTATAVVAGTPQMIHYTGALMDEVELLVTNSSGSTATISALLRAR